MYMYPKLSVITINLNNSEGLKQTLTSVLAQSFTDYEYIIIDGGSSDGSVKIIEEFENSEKYSKINHQFALQWISEPDKGIYQAMNKGIAKAKGEYCFFLNSGDYLVSSTTLEEVFAYNPATDIVFGNLLVCLNNKVVDKINGKPLLTFMDIYRSNVVKHQSSFIKRNLFEKFGLYNEDLRIVADWEFFLRILGLSNVSYQFVNIDIACFDNDGVSNNTGSITKKERNHVLETNIPAMMLADYRIFENYSFLKPAFRYKLPTFFLRVIAKCAKEFEKLKKKG
jgi:glycosyltransferase involved in cell wall biosynthesis